MISQRDFWRQYINKYAGKSYRRLVVSLKQFERYEKTPNAGTLSV